MVTDNYEQGEEVEQILSSLLLISRQLQKLQFDRSEIKVLLADCILCMHLIEYHNTLAGNDTVSGSKNPSFDIEDSIDLLKATIDPTVPNKIDQINIPSLEKPVSCNLDKLRYDDLQDIVLTLSQINWLSIDPLILGTIFQVLKSDEEQLELGIHYTSTTTIRDILQIRFLNYYYRQVNSLEDTDQLLSLHNEIMGLHILDPACGTGNFLVVTYLELKKLERTIMAKLERDITPPRTVTITQLYGIEIDPIAHYYTIISLIIAEIRENPKSATDITQQLTDNIRLDNALRIEWDSNSKKPYDFIVGNPPYRGYHLQNSEQKEDMRRVFADRMSKFNRLDYVAAWFVKAVEYLKEHDTPIVFLATNSIVQGQQPQYLWPYLISQGVEIDFAISQFNWKNELKNTARVSVIVLGLDRKSKKTKRIYSYSDEILDSHEVTNINPYLVDYRNITVTSRSRPLGNIPTLRYGNKPTEGGHLIIDDKQEMINLEEKYPQYVRELIGASQFLRNKQRWCLWLVDAPTSVLGKLEIKTKLDAVRRYRQQSKKKTTREDAATPHLFQEIRQPSTNYLLFPRHTSEQREYMTLGYYPPEVIVHDSCSFMQKATLYHFGVLSSAIHMLWVKTVAGRLGKGIRYSGSIVFNNFPWPQNPPSSLRNKVAKAGDKILSIRKKFIQEGTSLATLYNPQLMPYELREAHTILDRLVEQCYQKKPFVSNTQRITHLLSQLDKLREKVE